MLVRLVTKYSLWKSVALQGIDVPLGTQALEPVICVLVRDKAAIMYMKPCTVTYTHAHTHAHTLTRTYTHHFY